MAVPESGILIDCETVRNSDPDLPSGVEFVGSSSSATQHRSGAALAVIDDGSARDDGTEAEFVGFSDEQLRHNINRWRKEAKGLLAATPDGGEKMRIRLNRMEKELARREAVRRRKVRKMWILHNCPPWFGFVRLTDSWFGFFEHERGGIVGICRSF
jgi:hypothetical protein